MIQPWRVLAIAIAPCVIASAVLVAAWRMPVAVVQPSDEPTPETYTSAPDLLNLVCAGCHSNARTKVDFDGYLDLRVVARDPVVWKRVVRQLRSGEMPPPQRLQLSPDERERIISWVEEGLTKAAAAEDGTIMVRRLRRSEYVRAVQDLLGVTIPADIELPGDEDIGWDRCVAIPPLREDAQTKYQAAAARIVEDVSASTWRELAAVANHPAGAAALLSRFARRANRQPLEAEQIGQLVARFNQSMASGAGVEESFRSALQELLTSPRFLQRIEFLPDRDRTDPDYLGDEFALATRLSFLLWNSLPDDELLDQAQQGTLSANLEAQARRMLRDPRARRLAEDFANQWLGLAKQARWYACDESLEIDMRAETRLFVAAIVQEDRSVTEFLASDSSFLNERLARHYGVVGVHGEEMRRVSLQGTQRAGLLTQASILTATGAAARQSPVQRGKWIMENLLGTPPPAPPAGLLEAFAATRANFGPGTPREILQQHLAHESCAYCHAQMDALGIALENFDAIGAWRTHEYGKPVDAVVTLPTGETLDGPASVRAYLLERKDMFIRCLSEKLLSYGLARKLSDRDRQELEAIPAKVAQDSYRFSSVVVQVVTSEPFRRGF